MKKRIPNYALYGEAALPSWQDLLHLEWINRGRASDLREISAHRHDNLLQLIYVRRGQGEVSLENSRLRFRAPCIILLPQRTVHAFSYSADTDGPVITAAQRPLESIARILSPRILALLTRPRVFDLPWQADGSEPIWPLIQLLESEAGAGEGGNLAAGQALLVALLARVASLAEPVATRGPASGRRAALVGQFRELVDAQFRRHWTLGRYCEALGVTAATLGRACREEAGEAPLSIVKERLVREAQRQLAYTDLDVQQIARDLGFADAAYFARFFRRQCGVTPSDFRAAFLGSAG
ncbi:helix-turn-helix domain-containing protein [Pseudomonas oligotrophica]|uniref:helix-turn-helix domain-containing protein n=1 Tax=Pseudomonas oligotrophica TaxID=2912055 RepID=UPI001F028224|nr:helix-turn-helix domain-containing protein [Pseudomonas oligotrophica]MCF7202509.1 helix-turn-helix domain-containing protein [Pseudomonas oligotrophica]